MYIMILLFIRPEVEFKRQIDFPCPPGYSWGMGFAVKLYKEFKRPCPGNVPREIDSRLEFHLWL